VIKPNTKLVQDAPGYYMSMGHTAEEVANRFNISREEQDAFATESHKRAAKAIEEGKFKDEIVPVEVTERFIGKNNKEEEKTFLFEMDEGVRQNTSKEVLAKLRPEFHAKGSVTAGNSSQMSDGAGTVLVMDREKAGAQGLTPLVKFRSFAVAGVEPEIMGVGPVKAIPKAVKQAGLEISDIGLFELNEAFASQSVRVIQALDLDPSIVNVNGGA